MRERGAIEWASQPSSRSVKQSRKSNVGVGARVKVEAARPAAGRVEVAWSRQMPPDSTSSNLHASQGSAAGPILSFPADWVELRERAPGMVHILIQAANWRTDRVSLTIASGIVRA